jgi:hypothetical protein
MTAPFWITLTYECDKPDIVFYYVSTPLFCVDVIPEGESAATLGHRWQACLTTESETLVAEGPFEDLDEAKEAALNLARVKLRDCAALLGGEQ